MQEITISRDTIITEQDIGKILQINNTANLPELRHRINYYNGKQKILQKQNQNSDKQPNRIVTNFVREIIDNYAGYGVGIAPRITAKTHDEDLQEVLRYNDINEQISQVYTDGLIYGRGVLISYIDIDGKTRFCSVNPEQIIPIYSDDLSHDLLYVIRYWAATGSVKGREEFLVDLYGEKTLTHYRASEGFGSVNYLGEEAHHFAQVPVSIFSLNKNEEGLCVPIFSLQDCYNNLLSDANDDADAFADAILLLQGAFGDEDDFESLRKNRVLMLDENCDAKYLTKSGADSNSQNLLELTEKKIRQITSCPDFADEAFGTSSGVAMKFKLLGMSNKTADYWNRLKKCIIKQVELISEIEYLISGDNEEMWRDTEVQFTANLPIDETANANVVAQLDGLVSRETLYSLLPFVTDIKAEQDKLKKQDEQSIKLFDDTDDTEDNE